jgi:hypothetical protein
MTVVTICALHLIMDARVKPAHDAWVYGAPGECHHPPPPVRLIMDARVKPAHDA